MNYLLVIVGSILIVSCSSGKKHFTVETSLSSIGDESLARLPNDDLKKLAIDGPVMIKSLVKCYQEIEIDKTLLELKKSLTQEKNNPLYWNTIGSCYFLNKQYSTAQFYYLLALSNSKTPAQKAIIHNNIGMIHLRNESFQNALLYFQKAIELDRNLKTPYFNQGQIYIKYGLLDKAKENFLFLLKTGQQDMDLLFSLGMITLLNNDLKEAISYFSKIDNIYLKREDISTFYAWASYLQGNPTQAEIILDMQQVKIDPQITEMTDALTDLMKKDAEAEIEKQRKIASEAKREAEATIEKK